MSAARHAATPAECEQKVNEASWLAIRALEAGRADDDLAFDLRQAAEEAEDLAARAPTAELAERLRDAALKARAKADPDRSLPEELAHRRLDLRAAIAAADDEPPWRVDRLAADGFVTVLAGRGGEGKSIVTQHLAAGVQLGKTIAGFACREGNVAIFDAENGAPLIGRRLKQAATPLDRLTVYDAAGLDLDRDRQAIEQAIRHDQASLAVFDSLRTLAPRARENDSDDMAPIMGALRRIARDTQAAVVLLHHRDKALEHDFRGSGAIHDQADLVFVLDRDKADPERRWRRRIRCAKCRIDAEPPDRWIGIRHGRFGLHLTEAAAHEPAERPTDARDELASQALQILAAGDPIPLAEIARRLGRSPKDGTVRRALDRLEADGQAARGDRGWTVPPPELAPLTLEQAEIPHHNGNREGATEADGTPGTHGTGQRCQGAHTPEGGGADGTPTGTRTKDRS